MSTSSLNSSDKNWYCYFLKSLVSNKTYNGSTNNLMRRLRQHNGEIKGGAKRTHQSRPWKYYAILAGLPNHKNCLSCEWKLRYPNNKRNKPKKYQGIEGRIKGLNDVLKLDKWTNQCIDLNCNMNLEVWIERDYAHLLIDIPSHINIYIVDEINIS